MSQTNDPIIMDFIEESNIIIADMNVALEQAELGLANYTHLETYGQLVDRILGGAKTLAMNIEGGHATIGKIGDYAAVCKAVGYKSSQIRDNAGFYSVCIALLMDATEVLEEMFSLLEKNEKINAKEMISQTLIDRLKWVSGKFSAEYRESVAIKKQQKMNQEEIDKLLSKLGLD